MSLELRKFTERNVLAVLSIVALLFFLCTDPAHVPPVVLMVAFALLLAITYCLVRLACRALRLQDRLSASQYGGVVFTATVLPVLIIAMQSLGQLSLRDGVTIALLFGIGFFYASRLSGRRS